MRKICTAIALAILSVHADAATFNLFSPATGILKGSSSTYVTSAANSSDVRGLWSGTCDITTFLRGDGSCAAPSGTGTVTSVALTVPSGFSVGGSPVTSSGTLAITGVLNVSAGGTGVGTLTGPIKGNGTSALSAATAADFVALFTGCSGIQYLGADGACHSISGGTPAGSNTQVQFNDSGSFGADSSFTFDSGTDILTTFAQTVDTRISAYSDTTRYPVVIGKNSNDRNELIVVNTNSGASSRAGIVVGVDGQGAVAMRGSSSAYGTLLPGGPSGAAAAVHTGNSTPLEFGTNDVARMIIDGTGTNITVAQPFYLPNGSQSAPSLVASADTNTGLYFPAADDLGLVTGGVKLVEIAGNSSSSSALMYSNVTTIGTRPSLSEAITLTDSTHTIDTTAANVTINASTGVVITSPSVTIGGSVVCRANGTGCPGAAGNVAFGRFTVGGSACSAASATNITSCTYNGTGNVSVLLSVTVPTGWVCTASSSVNGTPSVMRTSGASTTGVNVLQYAMLTGTLTDTDFYLTCMGT